MKERGVDVDHATLNRWVIKYGPLLVEEAQETQAANRLLVEDGRDLHEGERPVGLSLSSDPQA